MSAVTASRQVTISSPRRPDTVRCRERRRRAMAPALPLSRRRFLARYAAAVVLRCRLADSTLPASAACHMLFFRPLRFAFFADAYAASAMMPCWSRHYRYAPLATIFRCCCQLAQIRFDTLPSTPCCCQVVVTTSLLMIALLPFDSVAASIFTIAITLAIACCQFCPLILPPRAFADITPYARRSTPDLFLVLPPADADAASSSRTPGTSPGEHDQMDTGCNKNTEEHASNRSSTELNTTVN